MQQVILNLIRNAGEAMDAVSNRERVLRVRSAIHNTNEVLVSIEDSDRASILKTSTGYSKRSTPQNRMVWEWDWRFVGRLSKRIRVAFGCPPAFNMGQCFGSLCRPAVSKQRYRLRRIHIAYRTSRQQIRWPCWPISTNFSLRPDVSFRGEAEVGGRQSSLHRSRMTRSGRRYRATIRRLDAPRRRLRAAC